MGTERNTTNVTRTATPGETLAEGTFSARQGEGLKESHGFSKKTRSLKVLLVGHQFQVPTEGQAKAGALAKFPELEIKVLTPARYREGETRWRYPQPSLKTGYQFQVERVALPWAGPAKWYLHWYPDLARTLHSFQPDVIDVWEEPWSLLSAQICWLRDRVVPAARIISETEQNVGRILPPPFEWFRSYTFRKADLLIGRNTEALQVARAKGYVGPASVVGNGVDTALFHPMDRQRCRLQFGIDGFAVGYVGRLVPEKGLQDLLDAFDGLPAEAGLWICGDGPMRRQLEKAGPRVHLLRPVPREKLPELFNALDILVLPSRTTSRWKEQFGRVIIEAGACGIPVVGSDSGAIPEVIGCPGLIFKEGDSEALRALLESLRANPSRAQQLGQEVQARVESLYCWEAIAQQMRELYRGMFLPETSRLERKLASKQLGK
jgi:glycosyltransferase involved in cell wall biosynthesis